MFLMLVFSLILNILEYEIFLMVKFIGFWEYDVWWLFEKEINLMGM